MVTQNFTNIIKNVNIALKQRGNKPGISSDVKVLGVTKNHSTAVIREAIAAGITAIGENRIQEALSKYEELGAIAEWHLIGHLQTNKVKQAVPVFDLIHSVDSERLAVEIDKAAGKINKRQNVLIQVNVAGEETKFGVKSKEVTALARFINNLENVRLAGLMTIAPFYEQPEAARPVFRELYQLFNELKAENLANVKLDYLSMGMTNDYMAAIEEGANLVRIGTGLFGTRKYN
ncbi:MAG: YggS family pyridoxal phosphate-dependent enzyme [Pelosinus sp.]|nr:YggS family pyridoxal phosphate-dependent enzyme [Pelosinus sp.]